MEAARTNLRISFININVGIRNAHVVYQLEKNTWSRTQPVRK
uniref:Uncharacterized protein n=1 Tax=Anguilla anguilla TaxID=7936 RepID=A0A0E9SKT9_ANGAN